MPVRRRLVSAFGSMSVGALAVLLGPRPVRAAPTVRQTTDVRGDVLVVGSTLGWDCGSGLTPPPGTTVSCLGETTATAADKAPDIYWHDLAADKTILPTRARTSATITLPAGATVVGARLYWSALTDGTALSPPAPDTSVLFGAVGGDATVTADPGACSAISSTGPLPADSYLAYQCSADVTAKVPGSGEYRVSDVSGILLNGVVTSNAYSAWALVVVYAQAGAPYRRVTVLDGLDFVDPGTPLTARIDGQHRAASGAAVLTTLGFAGGNGAIGDYAGDSLRVGGVALGNALNPASDFFNQTRSIDGAAVAGTTPPLSGDPSTMAGIDLDTLDVSAALPAGATGYPVLAQTTNDTFFLGGLVSSVESKAPNFGLTKTFVDLNGGAVLPGDVLEFTITATNVGDDEATNVSLRDALPAALTFVPGSLRIDGVAQTDVAGDDEAEYAGPTTTVTARLGAGATATAGGTLAVGSSATLVLRVAVTGAPGPTSNQAFLGASGALGAPPTDFPSDGDPGTPGPQATGITVVACDASGGCAAGQICDLSTNTCVDAGDAGDASASEAGDAASVDADGATTDATTDATIDATGDDGSDGARDGSGLDGAGDGSGLDGAGDTAVDGAVGDGGLDAHDGADAGDGSSDGGGDGSGDAGRGDARDGSLGNDADGAGANDTGAAPDDSGFVVTGGGCGCVVPAGSTGGGDAGLCALGLGALGLAARRRRRARAAR